MPEIWNKYGPTAARSHDRSKSDSRRPQSGTLDIHSHVMVPAAAELVKPHLPPPDNSAAPETIAVGRKQEADRRSRLTELNERLADLDSMGIAVQAIKPTPMQCYYNVPPEIGLKAAQLVNDGLAEFAARRPDRFVALGTVPLPDGHAAAAELERCMRKLWNYIKAWFGKKTEDAKDPEIEIEQAINEAQARDRDLRNQAAKVVDLRSHGYVIVMPSEAASRFNS